MRCRTKDNVFWRHSAAGVSPQVFNSSYKTSDKRFGDGHIPIKNATQPWGDSTRAAFSSRVMHVARSVPQFAVRAIVVRIRVLFAVHARDYLVGRDKKLRSEQQHRVRHFGF